MNLYFKNKKIYLHVDLSSNLFLRLKNLRSKHPLKYQNLGLGITWREKLDFFARRRNGTPDWLNREVACLEKYGNENR